MLPRLQTQQGGLAKRCGMPHAECMTGVCRYSRVYDGGVYSRVYDGGVYSRVYSGGVYSRVYSGGVYSRVYSGGGAAVTIKNSYNINVCLNSTKIYNIVNSSLEFI